MLPGLRRAPHQRVERDKSPQYHTIAIVTASDAEWLEGTDANGVPTFINQHAGEGMSHGSVHPGTSTSSLPSTLALPLALQ